MLSRFADDTKPRGEIGNTLEDQLKVQRVLICILSPFNEIQFNGQKCKVLQLRSGKKPQMHKYNTGGICFESSIGEKDLGVLVDHRLSKSQRCAATAQRASATLGCVNREIILRLWEMTVISCAGLIRLQLE